MTLAFQKEISALFRTHPLVLGYNHAKQALWERGSAGTLVRGPESQEGDREPLKSTIALAIDVLF